MLLTAAASSVLMHQQIHLQLVLGMTITSIAAALFYTDPGTLTGLNKASPICMQRLLCAVEEHWQGNWVSVIQSHAIVQVPTFPESPGTIKSFMPDRLKHFLTRFESNKHAFGDCKSSV